MAMQLLSVPLFWSCVETLNAATRAQVGNHCSEYPSEKKTTKKTKNDLLAMKQILYDMGPLTLVRWLLQRALKFEPPFRPRSKLKRVPPNKN